MSLLRALALAAALAWACPVSAEPIVVAAQPIAGFSPAARDASAELTFIGGLRITSEHRDFGGFSGLAVSPDGGELLLLNDAGSTLRARLVRENGRLVGLDDADIEPLYPEGRTGKRGADTEDLAFNPADASRGVIVRERQANAMLAFHLEDGRFADFTPVTVGAPNRILRSNTGLESVDYAPPGSPYAGRIVTIAEAPPRGAAEIPGWIVGVGAFSVVQRDGYAVSSARFLPDGDLILLERRLSPLTLFSMRLRRIPAASIRPGGHLDGPVLLEAGMASQIDNMEGLSIRREAGGRIVFALVSDDNFQAFQRTLILEFALNEAG